MSSRPLRARLIAGTRGQVIVTVLLLAGSFAAQVGIARRFSLLGLGEYTGTSLAVLLASLIAISGVPLSASERVARLIEGHDLAGSRRAASTGFVLAMGLSLVAAAIVFATWEAVADLLRLPTHVPPEAMALAVVFAGATGYVPLVFQARLEMAMVGAIAIAQPFAVVLALAWDTVSPGVRPATMAILGYVSAGLVALVAYFASGYSLRPSREELRPVAVNALRSLPVLYSNVAAAWVDRLLVLLLLGPIALGIYQAAAVLIDGALRIPRSASPFLVSAYARVTVQHVPAVGRVLRVHTQLWAAYGAVLSAVLIGGADGVATTLFGGGSSAVTLPLRILSVGMVPGVLALTLATATTGAGAASVAVAVSRASIPAQVALMIVLSLAFGVPGSAVAHAAAMAVTLLGYLWMSSASAINPRDHGLTRALAFSSASVLAATGIALLAVPWPLRAVFSGVAAIALVAPLLLGKDERAVVRTLITHA